MRTSASTLESELWPDELAYLQNLLRQQDLSGTHLEIGTAAGGTLKEMMSCYPAETRPHFMVVDPMKYFPDQMAKVRKNLSGHGIDPDSVDFRIGKSQDLFEQIAAEDISFDFILIDGNHKIRYVVQDLQWARLLNPGGFLCMHDYNRSQKGVMYAADRFMKKYANYERVDLISNLLVLRKLGDSPSTEISSGDLVWANLMAPVLQWERNIRKRLVKWA